jgi:zinc protease
MLALEVAAAVLSRGESSRLHQRIVRKDKVGVFAGIYMQALEHPGLMLVFGAHLLPEQAAKVEAAILDEMAKLHKTPVGARELSKAKNQLAAEFVYKLQKVTGLAWQIGLSWILTSDPTGWLDDYDRLMAVSAEDLQRVARTYLRPERLTLVAVPPGGEAGGAGGAK